MERGSNCSKVDGTAAAGRRPRSALPAGRARGLPAGPRSPRTTRPSPCTSRAPRATPPRSPRARFTVVAQSSQARKVKLSVTSFQGGPALTDTKRVKLRRGSRSVALSPQPDRQGGPPGLRGEPPDRHGDQRRQEARRARRAGEGRSAAPARRSRSRCPSAPPSRTPPGARRSPAPGPTACSRGRATTTPSRRPSSTPPGLRVNLDIDSTPANVHGTSTSTRPASTKATASVPARASSPASRASTIRPPSRTRAPSRSPTWIRLLRRTSRSC